MRGHNFKTWTIYGMLFLYSLPLGSFTPRFTVPLIVMSILLQTGPCSFYEDETLKMCISMNPACDIVIVFISPGLSSTLTKTSTLT